MQSKLYPSAQPCSHTMKKYTLHLLFYAEYLIYYTTHVAWQQKLYINTTNGLYKTNMVQKHLAMPINSQVNVLPE